MVGMYSETSHPDLIIVIKVLEANFVCAPCGFKYGAQLSAPKGPVAWIDDSECNICKDTGEVTDFRNFGGPHSRYLDKK